MFYSPSECGGCGKHLSEFPFGEEFLPYKATKQGEPAVTIYLCNSCTGIVRWTSQIRLELEAQYRIFTKPTEKPVRPQQPQPADPQPTPTNGFYEALRRQREWQAAEYQDAILRRAAEQQAQAEKMRRAVEYINRAESPQERHDRKVEQFGNLYGSHNKEALLKYLEDLKRGKTK